MTRAALVLLVVVASCGPPPVTEDEALRECDGFARCVLFDGEDYSCNLSCRANSRQYLECCECLAELDCLCENLTENRCTENLERGGSVCVLGDCSSDDTQCGTVCGFLD